MNIEKYNEIMCLLDRVESIWTDVVRELDSMELSDIRSKQNESNL